MGQHEFQLGLVLHSKLFQNRSAVVFKRHIVPGVDRVRDVPDERATRLKPLDRGFKRRAEKAISPLVISGELYVGLVFIVRVALGAVIWRTGKDEVELASVLFESSVVVDDLRATFEKFICSLARLTHVATIKARKRFVA